MTTTETREPEFTAEQVTAAIADALAEGNVGVVPGLISYLANIDPTAAQDVHDTIRLGLRIASHRDDRP